WAMPDDMLKSLPGYDLDVTKNRTEARRVMEKLGYASGRPLKVKLSIRNLPEFRDTAVLLIDQLKQAYIDAELELIETPLWFPRLARKEYQIAFIFSVGSVDDSDQELF